MAAQKVDIDDPGLLQMQDKMEQLNDDDQAAVEDAPDTPYDEALDLASDVGADDLNEAERLFGYWRMDEGEGTQIADVTDNKLAFMFDAD